MRLRIHCLVWILLFLVPLLFHPALTDAASYTWTGSGGNGNWNTAANWSPSLSTSDTSASLTFPGTVNYGSNPFNTNDDISTGAAFRLNQLIFSSGTPAIHVTGNALTFSSTATNNAIYQRSANTVTIDNAVSWSGTNPLTINNQGTSGLVLTGSITDTTSNGILSVMGNTVTLTGSLNTGSGGNLRVGDTGPGNLSIQIPGTNTITIGGTLYLNYGGTQVGDTSILTLQSGNLSVTGTTGSVIGNGNMKGTLANYGAEILQSGGSAAFSSLLTVGGNGCSNNLYDISGGTLTTNSGLLVGGAGSGSLNVHGSGAVTVSGGSGLVIGQNDSLATVGSVNLSGGSLTVNGNVTFGNSSTNKGLSNFTRSGGSMTVTGGLIVDGTGRLVLDATTNSVPTTFNGGLSRSGVGTLVIVPQTGNFATSNVATSESLQFSGTIPTTNGIVGPWAVVQVSGSNTTGDFISANGSFLNRLASYSTSFSSSTNVVNVSTSTSVPSGSTIYAMKTSATATLSGTLTLGSGGLILNGGTVQGGTLALGGTPCIYAGSNTAATISSSLQVTSLLTKFGPGSMVLSTDNSTTLTGGISICSGTLNVRNAGALGSGGTTVASGATLEIQGNGPTGITIGNVPITLNGTGVGGVGVLRNVQNRNSLGGTITLGSTSQIAVDSGFLTLAGSLTGSFPLTKTGAGTLEFSTGNSFSGPLTVTSGTLLIDNGGALGSSLSSNGTTIVTGTTLALQNYASSPEPLTISGTGVGNLGAVRSLSGTNGLTGSITLAADSQVNIDSGTLSISGGINGAFNLTKAGPGTLQLSGTNTFTGTFSMLNGTLVVSSVNNTGANGIFGAGTAPLVFGTSGTTPILEYTNTSAASSNRPFALVLGSTTNFQIDQVITGSPTLTLSGVIGGTGNFLKTGPGTLALGGTNTCSGTLAVTGGTLQITSGGSINGASGVMVGQGAKLQLLTGVSQLPDTGNITLAGGNLDFSGTGTTVENVGALVLLPGQSNITRSNTNGILCFSGTPIACSPGGVVNFASTASSICFQNTVPLTNGILGGFAFYNNADFATLSGTGPYAVSTLPAGSYSTGDLASFTTSSGSLNVKPNNSQSSFAHDVTINSLNLTGSIGENLNGHTLTLSSGGLIVNTTNNPTTISGGILTTPCSSGLVVNALQNVTISSTINCSLTKTGANTTLTLTNAYNNPGCTLTVAAGSLTCPSINCSTLIIGSGQLPGAGAASGAMSVPEPSSSCLLVIGLFLAIGSFGLRKRRSADQNR